MQKVIAAALLAVSMMVAGPALADGLSTSGRLATGREPAMTAEPADRLVYARVYCTGEGEAVLRVVNPPLPTQPKPLAAGRTAVMEAGMAPTTPEAPVAGAPPSSTAPSLNYPRSFPASSRSNPS